ncbi:MAG: anthranilate synthase component I family protein [Caulobacteraceae bacterium]|nr:anthranilate synthase component I family protein [Caulobacteraceae bacterium]
MQCAAIIETAWREPAKVLAAFADEPWSIGFLSGGAAQDARWSFVARQPDRTAVLSPDDPRDPFAVLRGLIGETAPTIADGPPFQGGVAGLAGYDLGARIEAAGAGSHPRWPHLACARYPAVLAFDHGEQVVLAVGRGADEASAKAAARRAAAWLGAEAPPSPAGALAAPPLGSPAGDYEAAVAQVVARIAAGEIFQANIARRWTGTLAPGARPFDLMARLARTSPAPFAAYLRLDGLALVSNSPERFVQVRPAAGGLVARTQPIKGTRPRGATPAEDTALAEALAASLKDRAENLMIVDLMRNDLARVCAAGGVKTPELFRVESFVNVHHLVSTVTGALSPGRTAIDLLRAAFPPGSITGAPKVQAMKVIGELEPPRGPFFGSMFWAGADGALDASVLIRTVGFERSADGWDFEARAGAGIVADSDPLAERLETEAKISAVLKALAGEA